MKILQCTIFINTCEKTSSQERFEVLFSLGCSRHSWCLFVKRVTSNNLSAKPSEGTTTFHTAAGLSAAGKENFSLHIHDACREQKPPPAFEARQADLLSCNRFHVSVLRPCGIAVTISRSLHYYSLIIMTFLGSFRLPASFCRCVAGFRPSAVGL